MAAKNLKQINKTTYQYTEKRMKKAFIQITLKYVNNELILTIQLFKFINLEFNITEAVTNLKSK